MRNNFASEIEIALCSNIEENFRNAMQFFSFFLKQLMRQHSMPLARQKKHVVKANRERKSESL